MNEKARGMSSGQSRHGSAGDFAPSRRKAIETLIESGILVRDRARLILVVKGKGGKEERMPVSVHATKGLLLHSNRRSTDPRTLLKIPRED